MSEAQPPYQPPYQPPPLPPPSAANPAHGAGTAVPGAGAPPPGYGFAPPNNADVRPKARWFWVGGLIMGVGVLAAVAILVFGLNGISNTVDDFQRVTNADGSVTLNGPAEYVIYVEGSFFFPNVEITSPDGDLVRTAAYRNSLTYDFNGRSGQAAATFQADTTGVYQVQTDSSIAIGESIAGDLVRTVLLPFAIGGIAFLVGLIVIIVTGVKRSRSKKQVAFAP